MKTKAALISTLTALLLLAIVGIARARVAQVQAQLAESRARQFAIEAEFARATSGSGPATDELHVLQADYKQALTELLDIQLERKMDVLLPQAQRHGEALAGKEQALAEKVGRLRAAFEAAQPPGAPASNLPPQKN